jgi:Carboxypeptidase regulatory-like domain/TonB-dependent Receptor Plug Domain
MYQRVATVALALVFSLCGFVHAQESASSGIVGQVTDSTRGALPGATVTVINVGTNAQRVATSDVDGRFSIPNLPAATYTVRIELTGFQTVELKEFVLRNGEVARPTVTLGLANVAETITVAGESPLLQTQSASVSQTIAQKQIEELPVNGRTLLSFASLSAGVTPKAFTRGTQFGAAGSSRNQYVTVEGGRDSSTNYTVDGVYVRSLRFNNLSLAPPIDSVHEVSVLRNAFSTEYGQGQAVVSIVTKSGTNQLSASAYESFRSDKFDARNFFAAAKPKLKRNQYGATGGGPIRENKIFVFGSYEGLRTTKELPFLASVPNPTFLAGDFSSLATPIVDPTTGQQFAGNIIPSGRFSNFARVLAPTVPRPNASGANNYNINKSFTDDADTFTVRSTRCSAPTTTCSNGSCGTTGRS